MESGRFLVACCAALLLVACPGPDEGSDGGSPGSDSGSDAGDGGVSTDAGPGPGFDAGRADASVDAGRPDGSVADAGPLDAGPRFDASVVNAGAPPPASQEFGLFAAQVAQAYCRVGQLCGQFVSGPRYAEGCENHFRQIFVDQFLGQASSVDGGRLVYDADAGSECLARFFGSPFDCGKVSLEQLSRCEGVVRGAVGDAGVCLSQKECGDLDYQCIGSEACVGTCLTVGMEGEPCPRDNLPCHPSLFCQRDAGFAGICVKKKEQGELCFAEEECDTSKGVCREGSCALLPTDLEPCPEGFCAPGHRCDYFGVPEVCRKYPAQNEKCTAFSPCDPRIMFCFDNGTTQTCQPKRGENELCESTAACFPGLFCEGGLCLRKLDAGASCQRDEFCGAPDNQCDDVLRTCVVPKKRYEGESCTTDTQFCEEGTFCRGAQVNLSGAVGDAGVCDRFRPGDLCKQKGVCPEFHTCELDAGINDAGRRNPNRCVPTGQGAICLSDFECPYNFYCDRSVADQGCQPRKPPGAICDPSLDVCSLGLFCVPTVDQRFACGRLPGLGELCHRDPPGNGCIRPLKCESAPPNPDGGIGRCIAGGLLGEPCDEDCFEGACRADGGVRVCIPPRDDGFPCTRGSECASQVCDPNSGLCRSACF